MTLDDAIRRMFTCATAERCAREEACFHVVQWARQRYEEEQAREALFRALGQQKTSEEIVYFTPPTWPEQWETARTACAGHAEIE